MQKDFEKGERPDFGRYHGFHHVELLVGNAKQAAAYYCARFGFKRFAYRGLETGHRDAASHAVKQNNIILVFTSPLKPSLEDLQKHVGFHGDGVKMIGLEVENCRKLFERARDKGADVVMEPWEESDEHGTVVMATIKTYGDTVHTFVERKAYKGQWLPGWRMVEDNDPLTNITGPVNLEYIDHIVGNQPDLEMEKAVEYYERTMGFHRFWSVDDSIIHTEYSSLRSIVVTDYDEVIKMPINEPANGKKKSQIQEYVDYYGGAGAQHIALRTENILDSVEKLRQRGLDFLEPPAVYYDKLAEKLKDSPTTVAEDMEAIKKLNILVDFDDNGYLLQIFTKPVEDRPTLFYEIIQRRNHWGFGAGNFQSLFEALELEQAKRGNLD